MHLITLLLGHFYAIVYGIIASTLCLAFLYLLGLTFLPCVIFKRTNFTTHPFFCGAALFSLIGWYGINLDISLIVQFTYLPLFVFLVGCFRLKRINLRWILDEVSIQIISKFFMTYVIFYLLAYVFLPQSFSSNANLLRWIGNNDILNYINITHYFTYLDPSNVVGHSYVTHFSYPLTAAVFYCFAFFSVFYQDDTITAAMPILYTCMGLIGLMIAGYCRKLFGLSHKISASIAAVVICSPFYRYIMGNYFLSTLMATIPLLSLLTETVNLNFDNKFLVRLLYFTVPCQILIFFFYPLISFSTFIVQIGLIGLVLCCQLSKLSFKKIAQKMASSALVLLVSLIILFLLRPSFFSNLLGMLLFSANITVGGWGLPLISPWGFLGLPGPVEISSFSGQIIAIVIFMMVMGVCVYHLISNRTTKIRTSGLAFFCFTVMAFLVYVFYFYHLGPLRYQPWKFASYYFLPFSGSLLAVLVCVVMSWNEKFITKQGIVLLAAGMILGNAIHAWYFEPPFQVLSGKYRRLNALDQMNVSEFWIKMSNYSSTFLPVYFIPHKKLSLLSDSYYPVQALNFDEITSKKPLFMETETVGKCVGATPSQTIRLTGVGCLYLKAPTIRLNEVYSFSDRPVFIEASGLSNVESWGEWSDHSSASLTIYSNAKLLLEHPTGYIHIKVKPFLYSGMDGQPVNIHWGGKSVLSLVIQKEQWIVIPYQSSDWQLFSSKTLKKMVVYMDFSKAMSPHQQDAKSNDTRLLALGFIQLFVTEDKEKTK